MHLNVFWSPEKQQETYVLVEDIINLRGSGQVLLFVPLLGFVCSQGSLLKGYNIVGWCNAA